MFVVETGPKREIKCLEVKVGKNVHKLPLGADLPMKFAFELRKVRRLPKDEQGDAMFDVLADYVASCLGDDAESLTMGDLSQVIKAWSEASDEGGASAGE